MSGLTGIRSLQVCDKGARGHPALTRKQPQQGCERLRLTIRRRLSWGPGTGPSEPRARTAGFGLC